MLKLVGIRTFAFGGMAFRSIGVAVGALALLTTGCGDLSIRTWVKVIQDQSNGQIESPAFQAPVPITRLQGGFLGNLKVNTNSLPAPLDGTIGIDRVSVAGLAGAPLGALCVWRNPNVASNGTVHLDILGGNSTVTLNLDVFAQAQFADTLGVPPSELQQNVTISLGGGLGLTQLLAASTSGSADGLFAANAPFVGDTEIIGNPAKFTLNLAVSNESTPPIFDADLNSFCGAKFFAQQGKDVFYGLNSKSSYLLANSGDSPTAPTVIPLADIGAHAGQKLKITRVGTFNDKTELKDGTDTKVTAVFSSSNVILEANKLHRVQGAINAGTDFRTGTYQSCFIWPFCIFNPTDIAEDFLVDPGATVTIPTGAQFLVVAPYPKSLNWGDDSGFGFGVTLEIVP